MFPPSVDEGGDVEGLGLGGSEGGSVEDGESDGDEDEGEDGSDLVVLDPNHVSTYACSVP